MKTLLSLITLVAPLLLATPPAIAANHGTSLPASLHTAHELVALPAGGWLALDKRGLSLYDSSGKQRASLAMRAKQLDVRADAQQALAVVLDSDIAHSVSMQIDLLSGKIGPAQPLPQQSFAVETLCLFRDQQQLNQLFIVGKDGQAEQWLMSPPTPRLIRKLALPLQSNSCRVDDARHQLFIDEPGLGLWAYEAASESAPARKPVLVSQPHGHAALQLGAFALRPDGLAVLAADGRSLHYLLEKNGIWQVAPAGPAASAKPKRAQANRQPGSIGFKAERLLVQGDAVYVHDKGGKQWQWVDSRALAPVAMETVAVLQPQVQTELMPRLGDAADDPAIWVHPHDASASRIVGTNKKQGLVSYDMQGRQVQLLDVGRLNNVDIRQRVQFGPGSATADLAVATNRNDNSLMLFDIAADGKLGEAARFATGLDNIYGVCSGQPKRGGLDIFVNDKDGRYQHYGVSREGGRYQATLLRQFKLASQPEGCVVDDVNERLFLGEEKHGLWAISAKADGPVKLQKVLAVGQYLHADVEGMAIHAAPGKPAYLVVSSQGDNSYVVLDALPPWQVRGRFRIGFNLASSIDGASETDGLDVTASNLGPGFEQGMLVVQDGYKRLPDGAQNFKYVRWQDVVQALKLP